jgi:outer membrane protein assembly factor BamB
MLNSTVRHIIIKHAAKAVFLASLTASLAACNGFFEKDNTPTPTPLTHYRPEVAPHRLWSVNTGTGAGDEYLKMSPAINDNIIVTAGVKGVITAVNKRNGQILWQNNTRMPMVAGPGIGDGIIVAVSSKGDILALQEANGRAIWKTSIAGEVIAAPAIARGIVVVKAVDGILRGLSVKDGHEVWSFKQTEPALILRGSSTPLVRDKNIIVGFANGNLAKVSLNDGQMYWQQAVAAPAGAFAIERMIDIDADPIVYNHHIYVATYQGSIASLDWTSGRTVWSHDISSYTGMTADSDTVFITDAKGDLWAFNADGGSVNWRQTQLEARILTGPADMGNYVVVGDAQGYLHWLSKSDGHFVARDNVGSGIYTAPMVENNVLYALTNKGTLVAYRLG